MSMLGMSGFDELTNARWVLQKQFIERMFDINEQPKAWYNPNVFVQIYT